LRQHVRNWLVSTVSGLPSAYWHLWLGTLINRAGSFVIIYLAIYLTTVRGFQPSQAGLVMGLWAAGGAVGTVLGGMAADRIGRRPTLLFGHFSGAAVLVALAFTDPYWLIALLVFLYGLCADSARPAFSAMMADIVPAADRLRAFTLNYWAINLGFALAATLAGLAARVDPHLLFLADAGSTLVAAVLLLVKVGESRPARIAPVAADATRGALRTVLADRVFLIFLGVNLMISFVFMQHLSTLPIAMAADGLPTETFGLVIALNGVLIVGGQLFIPRLIRGRDRTRVLATACVVIGVGFGLTAFAGSTAFYAITVLVWTFGEMLNSPSNSTLTAALSPTHLRGRYQGTMSLSWSVAGFAAPVVGGYVQQHHGDTVLWLGCGALALLAAAGHLWSGPARERRVLQLQPPLPQPPLPQPATQLPLPPGGDPDQQERREALV
jgi:MFS family permease